MLKFIRWGIFCSAVAGILITAPTAFATAKLLKLTSPAFKNGGSIPEKYAFAGIPEIPGGQNISPPLEIWVTPKERYAVKKKIIKAFAISVIDKHPIAEGCEHMLAVNIPKETRTIEEGAFSAGSKTLLGAVLKTRCMDLDMWAGPAPPPGEPHVYEFTLYALRDLVENFEVGKNYSEEDFLKLLEGKIVRKAKLKGKFQVGAVHMPGEITEGLPPAKTAAQPTTHAVDILSSGFSPSSLEIKNGDMVTWTNKDAAAHWVASDVHPSHSAYPQPGGCLGSKFDACRAIQPGETFSFNFFNSGAWGYHDHFNSGVKGMVIVK